MLQGAASSNKFVRATPSFLFLCSCVGMTLPCQVLSCAGDAARTASAETGGSAGSAASKAYPGGTSASGAGGPGTSGAGGAVGRENGGTGGGGTPTSTGGGAGSSGMMPSSSGGVTGWQCPPGPLGAPLPAGATPTRMAGIPPADAFNQNGNAFGIMEGPVWSGDALYVSEIGSGNAPPPSRILQITGMGTVTVLNAMAGTNGLAVDAAGQLWAANHMTGAISRVSLPDGTLSDVVGGYGGTRFDSPNDLAIRSDGTLYFSDPDYQAPTTRPQSKTRVYRVAAGSSTATVVDESRSEPNGVTLSPPPAQDTLYVSGADGIYSYPVMPDGSVGQRARFGSLGGGDGMTVDCAGNLYVASNTSVVVLSSTGSEIGRLTLSGVQSATNVAFGGPDHSTLFITALGGGAQKGLFRVTTSVPGLPY